MAYISWHERPMVVLQEEWFLELLLLELSGEPVSMPAPGLGAEEFLGWSLQPLCELGPIWMADNLQPSAWRFLYNPQYAE